jgi:ankyrin repeat protein
VAALHGNAESIELLLAAGVDVNGTNKYGATPLIYATGDRNKVRALLAHGADPNRASLLGTTPLIAAAGYPDSARSLALLLEAGANIHATNKTGFDAVWRAAYGGHTEAVKLLLKRGANPNTRAAPTDHSRQYRTIHCAAAQRRFSW